MKRFLTKMCTFLTGVQPATPQGLSIPQGLSSPPETNLLPPGEGPLCQHHCRAVWQCFRSQMWKTGEPSISCQNAPDCTKLRLKFQNFPGGDTPGPPSLGRGTPPPQTPPHRGPHFSECAQSLNPALFSGPIVFMFQYYISYAVSFVVFRHHLCDDLIVIVINWLVKKWQL